MKKVLRKVARIIVCILGISLTVVFFLSIYLDYYFMKVFNSPPVFGFGPSAIMAAVCFLLPGIVFLVVSYRMKRRDINPIKEEDTHEFLS